MVLVYSNMKLKLISTQMLMSSKNPIRWNCNLDCIISAICWHTGGCKNVTILSLCGPPLLLSIFAFSCATSACNWAAVVSGRRILLFISRFFLTWILQQLQNLRQRRAHIYFPIAPPLENISLCLAQETYLFTRWTSFCSLTCIVEKTSGAASLQDVNCIYILEQFWRKCKALKL